MTDRPTDRRTDGRTDRQRREERERERCSDREGAETEKERAIVRDSKCEREGEERRDRWREGEAER